jgi:hypothetical protein
MSDKATKKGASKKKEQPVATQMPLFYSNPEPIDLEKHKSLALKKDFSLDFANHVNAVPINLIEMPQICHFYPIAFSPDEHATPVAILGLRDQENLFVNKDGSWREHTYVPAYIRRYPFIFSEIPNTEQLTLCIDNVDSVIEKGGEQLFFNDKGEPSDLSKNALEFCKSYHAAAQQTIEFSKALADADILVDRQAEIETPDGKKISFSGFRIIDEKKFAELKDETFLEWRKNGWLPFLYAHLFSGAQWQRLTRLLGEREAK